MTQPGRRPGQALGTQNEANKDIIVSERERISNDQVPPKRNSSESGFATEGGNLKFYLYWTVQRSRRANSGKNSHLLLAPTTFPRSPSAGSGVSEV